MGSELVCIHILLQKRLHMLLGKDLAHCALNPYLKLSEGSHRHHPLCWIRGAHQRSRLQRTFLGFLQSVRLPPRLVLTCGFRLFFPFHQIWSWKFKQEVREGHQCISLCVFGCLGSTCQAGSMPWQKFSTLRFKGIIGLSASCATRWRADSWNSTGWKIALTNGFSFC